MSCQYHVSHSYQQLWTQCCWNQAKGTDALDDLGGPWCPEMIEWHACSRFHWISWVLGSVQMMAIGLLAITILIWFCCITRAAWQWSVFLTEWSLQTKYLLDVVLSMSQPILDWISLCEVEKLDYLMLIELTDWHSSSCSCVLITSSSKSSSPILKFSWASSMSSIGPGLESISLNNAESSERSKSAERSTGPFPSSECSIFCQALPWWSTWALMSLVPWYGSIHFYFWIYSISALMLTYYDAEYQHDALHELHEPSWSLALKAWFFTWGDWTMLIVPSTIHVSVILLFQRQV